MWVARPGSWGREEGQTPGSWGREEGQTPGSWGREKGQTPGSQLRHQLGGPYGPVVRTSVLALMPAADDEVSEFHLKTPGQEVEKKQQLTNKCPLCHKCQQTVTQSCS